MPKNPISESNYRTKENVDVVREFLTGCCSAEEVKRLTGIKYFGQFSDLLMRLDEAVVILHGQNKLKPELAEALIDEVLSHQRKAPLCFYMNEIHGISLEFAAQPPRRKKKSATIIQPTNEDAQTVDEAVQAAIEETQLNQEEADSAEVDIVGEEGDEGTTKLVSARELFTLLNEAADRLTEEASVETVSAEMAAFVGAASEYLLKIEREFLETALYIGAAMMRVRLQASLLDSEDAKNQAVEKFDHLVAAILSQRGIRSQASIQRISLASRKSVAAFLDEEAPRMKNSSELGAFYQKSVEAIPRIIKELEDGKLHPDVIQCLNAIPTLKLAGGEASQANPEVEKSATTGAASASRIRGLLSKDSSKFQDDFSSASQESQKVTVESAVMGIASITDFLEKSGRDYLKAAEITALVKRLKGLRSQK